MQKYQLILVNKWKQTKNKKIVFKTVDAKAGTRNFDIYKISKNYLNEEIDYRRINMIKKVLKMVLKYIKNILLQIEKKNYG